MALITSLVFVPVVSVNAATPAFTNQPAISSAEREGNRPLPVQISWESSGRVADGDEVLDHYNVVIKNNSGSEICSLEINPDEVGVVITKTLCGSLYKVYKKYTVYLSEVRVGDEETNASSKKFYTGPPKLRNVRMRNKELQSDGTVNATIKWRKPTALNGVSIKYAYKISRRNNKTSLIKSDYQYGDINSIDVTGLPQRKMRIKVRAEGSSTSYGNGRWSDVKFFNVPRE